MKKTGDNFEQKMFSELRFFLFFLLRLRKACNAFGHPRKNYFPIYEKRKDIPQSTLKIIK